MFENATLDELKLGIESLEVEMAAYKQGVRSLLHGRGFEQTARSIFDICKKLVSATAGYVTLLAENGTDHKVLFLDSGEDSCTVNSELAMPLQGLSEQACRNAKVVYCNHFSESELQRFLPPGHISLKNVMFAPLVIDGKVMGLIGLANKKTDFSEKDACRAEVFGEFAAMALRNAQAEEQRQRDEIALAESEDKFRMMFHTSPDAICLSRLSDGRYIDVNNGFLKLSGYGREELIGRTSRELDVWVDSTERDRLVSGLKRNGSVENMEIPLRIKNGQVRTGLLSARILKTKGQDVLLSVIRDISDRKQAEMKLRESEAKYRQIVEHAPSGIYEVDLGNLKLLSVNEIICQYTGYTEEELLSMSLFDLVAEESKSLLVERSGMVREGKVPPTIAEYKIRTKQGNFLWALISVRFVSDTIATAVVHDITERKRIEEELRFTASNLALATEAAEMGFWHWDISKDTLVWDRKMHALHGIRSDDFGGAREMWKRFLHPEDFPAVLSAIQDAMTTRGKFHSQFRVICPGGQIRALECHAVVLCDAEGKPRHMIGVNRDITERKDREKNLRLQKELLQSILDNIPLLVGFQDAEGRVGWVNRTWEEKLGWSFAESRGITMKEFYPDPEECRMALDFIHRADGVWRNFRTRTRNGTFIDTRWIAVKLSDGTIIGIGEDISERKQEEKERQKLKEQLNQAQKMEAIGTLAGGIAHDFNNLLFPIMGYAEMLKDDLPPSGHMQKSVQQILSATKRATELVRQILTFSRQTEREIRPLEIQPILKEVMKLSRSSLPATIDIIQDIDSDCGQVLADPTQIHQLLMNLITNAYHAMDDDGGVLTISLQTEDIVGVHRKGKTLRDGTYLKLTVKDTGMGMDAAILSRIFDPYFTTKPVDKGTGLGLPVVHGIVKSLKGDIFVESKPGNGTTFEVYLPRYEQVEHRGTVLETTDPPIPTGNERILLVDDEDSILYIEKLMLEKLGYRIHTSPRSLDALETFRADPDSYDLVITDMTMPQMTGERLAKACMEIREDIPIILCTGFSGKIDAERAAGMGIKGFLNKPFIRSELAYTVRKALDATGDDRNRNEAA